MKFKSTGGSYPVVIITWLEWSYMASGDADWVHVVQVHAELSFSVQLLMNMH